MPVLAVARLTKQKGIDLLLDALNPFLQQQDVQLIVLGTGDPALERALRTYQSAYPQKVVAAIQFDTQLAQQIYAASDIFLMPSAFEPCGLSQMMAMHYGRYRSCTRSVGCGTRSFRTIAIPVRNRLWLDDYQPAVLRKIMILAVTLYRQHPLVWRQLQHQAMTCDLAGNILHSSTCDLSEANALGLMGV